MSNSFRLFVISAFLLVSFLFIYPTIKWYWMIPEKDKIDCEKTIDQLIYEDEYPPSRINEIRKLKKYRERVVSLGLDIIGGIHVVLEADFEAYAEKLNKTPDQLTDEEKKEAINRVLQKVRNRIDEFGVTETSIRKKEDDRIAIEVPGAKDPERIRDIIRRQGVLEFRFVDEKLMGMLDFDREKQVVLNTNIVPATHELKYLYKKNEYGQSIKDAPVVVEKKVAMSGKRIAFAKRDFGNFNENTVSFRLDAEGAQQFSDITATNVDRILAIILDGRVQSMPRIKSHIPGGSGVIEGRFSPDEANDLAVILKSGALDVPIRIESEDFIGPKMGKELMQKSFLALILGLGLVVVFMLVWYRLSGVIANIALLLNAFMLFSILAALGFTISLPSIAGVILTIGMAIDANVIIFERIKEEYFHHKVTIFEAIDKGYSKAFWTIFDSNITTLIAAIILSSFGSGPIKGFAVTLLFGILVSLFTSLFLSRYLFIVLIQFNVIKKYSKLII